MNPELSRRVAKAKMSPGGVQWSTRFRSEIAEATSRAKSFTQLPARFRRAVLEAEASVGSAYGVGFESQGTWFEQHFGEVHTRTLRALQPGTQPYRDFLNERLRPLLALAMDRAGIPAYERGSLLSQHGDQLWAIYAAGDGPKLDRANTQQLLDLLSAAFHYAQEHTDG